MRTIFLLALLSGTGGLFADDTPVIVELFTSQGCSSCPPADELVAEFADRSPAKNVLVIPLVQHVDYWNRLGWVDPFSSAEFSQRQETYQRHFGARNIYTPQAIVNGKRECVGSDRGKLVALIKQAADDVRAEVTIDVRPVESKPSDRIVRVNFDIAPADKSDFVVLLAVTEDGLVTDVKRGENAGRQMRGVGVVRRMVSLGNDSTATIEPVAEWNSANLRLVAFVQHKTSMAIVGAATISWPD